MNSNEQTPVTEEERLFGLKTACFRIARHGLQQCRLGNTPTGVACIKIAEAIARGHDIDETIAAFFPQHMHDKVAADLDQIARTPSTVAVETIKQGMLQQKLATAQQEQAAPSGNDAPKSDAAPTGAKPPGGGGLGLPMSTIAGGIIGGGAAGLGALGGNRKRNALIAAILGAGAGAAGMHYKDNIAGALSSGYDNLKGMLGLGAKVPT